MQGPSGPEPDYGDRSHHVRRGHTPQISISDESHHVTEAIGGMYGSDDEDYIVKRNSRPLSFIRSPAETFDVVNPSTYFDNKRSAPPRTPLAQTASNEKVLPPPPPPAKDDASSMSPARKGSMGSENSPVSPGLSRKSSSSETAVQQFPLNDIDYESSPAAVAQELSNLQAIRRMSMNVDTADPDLPSFTSGISASPSTDEDDASRLFWVPARLHPELAPKEFKTFVEDRVDRMRQRSGSGDSLSPTSLSRSDSGSLRRRKSMLSQQINNPKGYEDGAERLERKRSEGRNHHHHQEQQASQHSDVETLAELETLVNDPENVIRKISLDTSRQSLDSGIEVPAEEDMPILPPVGMSLKRSTRTTYRKGSVRKGDFSKRTLGHRRPDQDGVDNSSPLSVSTHTEEPVQSLTRVQTEPIPPPAEPTTGAEQQRQPGRSGLSTSASSDDLHEQARQPPSSNNNDRRTSSDQPRSQFHSRISSNGRTTAQIPGVPQIIETPPPSERGTKTNTYTLPERKSSHAPPPSGHSTNTPPRGSSASRGAHTRPALVSQRTQHGSSSTLDDISSNPSPLPGSGNTRTDALTMVPTFEEKKVEKKKGGDRKTSWNWLLGGEEKDKDREKQRDKDERDKEEKAARKGKSSSRTKGTDKTRLDVLQSSIDGNASPRGRESLVLDRESIQLEEERKKQSTRKGSDSSSKKDKDSGILSAIFGGGKRAKSAEETAHKKRQSSRTLSLEPPPRILRPDIDYNWTRFSILEERAIYRMAHIKLANPKRALHSQVLLSNFMYSYLAKVQMMHPQMQIPAAQKAAQAKSQDASRGQNQNQSQNQSQSQERQAEEYSQYQRWQEQQMQQQQQQQQQHYQVQGDALTGAEHGHGSDVSSDDGSSYQGQQHRNHASHAGGQHDYLGYAEHEQPFEQQQSLWEDGESKEEDLW